MTPLMVIRKRNDFKIGFLMRDINVATFLRRKFNKSIFSGSKLPFSVMTPYNFIFVTLDIKRLLSIEKVLENIYNPFYI